MQIVKCRFLNLSFQGTDSLVLPYNAPLKNLEAIKKAIENVLNADQLSQANSSNNVAAAQALSASNVAPIPESSTFSTNVETIHANSSSNKVIPVN